MATFTVTINDTKLDALLDAIAFFHPIPLIPDPGDPTSLIPEFTKNQWGKQWLKRQLNITLNKYETHLAQVAVAVPRDDTIVDVT